MFHTSYPIPALSRFMAASSLAAAILLGSVAPIRAQEEPAPIGRSLSRSFPFRYVGRLTFRSDGALYIGSGTVVRPSGVLTAAHNLYDPRGGFSTNVLFERAKYGRTLLSKSYARNLYVLSGYTNYADFYGSDSSAAFSRDVGTLRFGSPVASGGFVGTTATPRGITGTGEKIPVGYGAEWHSGSMMLGAYTRARSYLVRSGYYDNNGFIVEAGQSGGPVFNLDRVAAVLVSGSWNDAGIRAVDSTVVNFIRATIP